MKKIGIIFLILSFFTIDAAVNNIKKNDNIVKAEIKEIRAVYISYLEYYDNFSGGSKTINQSKIDKMINNLKMDKFNTIILHVSPFSDSIYNSKIFPYSSTLTGVEGKNPGFDYLDYFIKKAHLNNMQLYAWINPYRISFDNNINNLSKDNPALKFIDTTNIKIDKKGIYYNPASEIVKNLILRGVEEIINNYDVDGIHFDDYFYIQDDIDKLEYKNYLKNNKEISLSEFRLNNTNDLIKRVYKTIKEKNSNISFSIAPDGNINNNYLYHFADVKTWLKSNEYIDIIMPQIYYGFENEYSPFLKVLNNWENLRINKNIKIVPVLAYYKLGLIDKEAGIGKEEWLNNDIIINQINVIRNKKMDGYSLFRYDYLYNESLFNEVNSIECKKIKKINENSSQRK